MNNQSKRKTDGTSKNNWRTPPWLWERLQAAFNFEVDGASDGTDNLLPNFHTTETLIGNRHYDLKNRKVFINPPFDEIGMNKVKTALRIWLNYSAHIDSFFTVFLIPFAPETGHFQNWVWPCATVFAFNKRINYVVPGTNKIKKGIATPSCLAVYSREPIDKNLLGDLGIWVKKL